MKLNPCILSSALCSGILLGFTPAIFAQEHAAPEIMICPGVEIPEVVVPEIIICPGVELPEVVVPEIIICPGVEVVEGVELNGDGVTVVTEEDTTTTTDEQVDSEEIDNEVITWDIDWLERGEGGEEIYYMTTGGPSADTSNSNAATVEADKETVVTTRAEKAPKLKTVQQNSAKPAAVKSNGRVFLLK
jgi:hypothetical protein